MIATLALEEFRVCYKLEQDDLAKRPSEPDVPDDVKKVLPSGMWLMSTPPPPSSHVVAPPCTASLTIVAAARVLAGDGSIQKPS